MKRNVIFLLYYMPIMVMVNGRIFNSNSMYKLIGSEGWWRATILGMLDCRFLGTSLEVRGIYDACSPRSFILMDILQMDPKMQGGGLRNSSALPVKMADSNEGAIFPALSSHKFPSGTGEGYRLL
jgi:hypothetical protein